MTSVTEQFEFVTRRWVGNPDFRDSGSGPDPLIGRPPGHSGPRRLRTTLPDGTPVEADAPDFVLPTGGEYLFAPSLRGLRALAEGSWR